MLAIILAALLTVSNYPLNPTEQDTVNAMNLHVTTGISSQSGMISASPEFTLKYEFLFNHPFIFRTSFEYIPGKIESVTYPDGTVERKTISSEIVYYRGTQKLTAYLGLGAVYSKGDFNLEEHNFFDNKINGTPREIKIDDAFGYRFLLGLRFNHRYSLEVVITEISPSLLYYYQTDQSSFAEERLQFRANYVKVSLGYLFKIK